MKNRSTKAASKAMRVNYEEALTEMRNCPNGMFRLVRALHLAAKMLKEDV